MRKLAVLAAIILILAIGPDLAISAPQNIRAIPRSGEIVDIMWQGQPGESYDIWQTQDGVVWSNIYTTGDYVEYHRVDTGIEPYRNYYFLVSTANTVTDPNTDATVSNATYVAPAYPPNELKHYLWTEDNNLCADCHNTHTGLSDKLLKYKEVDNLCLTCHDGSMSKYDVLSGMVDGDGAFTDPLLAAGGAFGETGGHSGAVPANATVSESSHTLGVLPSQAAGGNPNSTQRDLSCVSCHTAHNTTTRDTTNYRMLVPATPEDADVRVGAYAVTDKLNGLEKVNYKWGMNDLCTGCHADYYAGAGAGSTPATGTYQTDGKYRHAVGVAPSVYALNTTLPLEGTGTDKKLFCLTCHYAHGSTKQTALSDNSDVDGQTIAVNYLLRRDYWSMCQDCHKK